MIYVIVIAGSGVLTIAVCLLAFWLIDRAASWSERRYPARGLHRPGAPERGELIRPARKDRLPAGQVPELPFPGDDTAGLSPEDTDTLKAIRALAAEHDVPTNEPPQETGYAGKDPGHGDVHPLREADQADRPEVPDLDTCQRRHDPVLPEADRRAAAVARERGEELAARCLPAPDDTIADPHEYQLMFNAAWRELQLAVTRG